MKDSLMWSKVADYTVHSDTEIKGFQGEFRWLSNFYPAETMYEDMLFPTSENAYQAAKLMDAHLRTPFQTCTPSQAKKLWKTFDKFFLYDYWEEIKFAVMYDCVFDKFIRNSELCVKLLSTGNKYLEERNNWGDQEWGVCRGEGRNKLGHLLMHVREELRDDYLPM